MVCGFIVFLNVLEKVLLRLCLSSRRLSFDLNHLILVLFHFTRKIRLFW